MKESAPERGAGSDDPTGRDCCRRQDRPAGHLEGGEVRTGSSNADGNDSNALDVEVSLAPNAAVCGSLGCRKGGKFARVTVGAKTRVLCPQHAVEFVEREAADE
jgi:hypothetical protein